MQASLVVDIMMSRCRGWLSTSVWVIQPKLLPPEMLGAWHGGAKRRPDATVAPAKEFSSDTRVEHAF